MKRFSEDVRKEEFLRAAAALTKSPADEMFRHMGRDVLDDASWQALDPWLAEHWPFVEEADRAMFFSLFASCDKHRMRHMLCLHPSLDANTAMLLHGAEDRDTECFQQVRRAIFRCNPTLSLWMPMDGPIQQAMITVLNGGIYDDTIEHMMRHHDEVDHSADNTLELRFADAYVEHRDAFEPDRAGLGEAFLYKLSQASRAYLMHSPPADARFLRNTIAGELLVTWIEELLSNLPDPTGPIDIDSDMRGFLQGYAMVTRLLARTIELLELPPITYDLDRLLEAR